MINKKITALFLAVMLIFGLSIPAMAAGESVTGTYTGNLKGGVVEIAAEGLAANTGCTISIMDVEADAQIGGAVATTDADGKLAIEVTIGSQYTIKEDNERYEISIELIGGNKIEGNFVQFDEEPDPVDPDDEGKKPVAPTGPSGKPTDPDPTDPTDPEQPGTVTSIYTDIAGHWAVNNGAIQYVYDNKLMTGVTGTTFAPNATTTRAQIFVILARRAGVDTEGGSIWYQKGLDWMVANNYSDGTNPNNAITRQELAALLYRVIGAPEVTGDLAAYPDASAVSAWATNAMLWATQNGIITGTETGALNPAGNATRAEVATILMRFCQQYPVQPPVAE